MANEHDEAIEKVLAALKNAPTPDGMENRIAERLENHTAAKAQSGWRDLLAGSTLASAWWRGALTGGLLAAAACALFLFESHPMHPSPTPPPTAYSTAPPAAVPVSATRATPCSPPAILRAHTNTPAASVTIARSAAPEHGRPIVQLGLTSEERALVRLTRVADPHQIATLNSETQASLDAEDAAAFKKFFTPPPRPRIDEWQPPSAATQETAPTQQSDEPKSDDQPTPPTADSKGQQ